MNELNEVELVDFNKIVQDTVKSLLICADKHNIDRDSFIRYFSVIFGTMAEVATFQKFGEKMVGEKE